MDVPPSSSDHPAAWKFDFPIYHPVDLAAWRAWLTANHATARGCWVASWRGARSTERVPYPDLVEEALCWGWIDSTANTLDDERGLQMMTPRKPKSSWTRLNRRRVADMEAQGRMTDAGRRAVEIAKANGWWTILDPVEDLIEPDDLRAPSAERGPGEVVGRVADFSTVNSRTVNELTATNHQRPTLGQSTPTNTRE